MIDNVLLSLTPWQAQIMMLPVRRPDPDAKRNGKAAYAARANACRSVAMQKIAATESKIKEFVRKKPGITASEVAELIGFSRNYTYKTVRNMIDEGILRREFGLAGHQPLYLAKGDNNAL